MRALLPLLASALVLGCPSSKPPLPGGPPPEYEKPRSYEPDGNIDQLSEEGGEGPLERDTPAETSEPPAPGGSPTTDPAPDAPAPKGGGTASPEAPEAPEATSAEAPDSETTGEQDAGKPPAPE